MTGWSTEAREEAITYMARPKPAITRDRWHRYTYEGVTYPGVTSIIKVVDKSKPLMAWAARQAVAGVLDQVDALPTLIANNRRETLVKMLAERSSWDRDKAAAKGTDIHAAADLIVRGLPVPDLDPQYVTHAAAFTEWWASSGWRLRLSEALVINPTQGYGGTFDLLAYDENGQTVLADYKTGETYPEHRLQLVAYAGAEYVSPMDSLVVYPMPRVDRHVILLLRENEVEAVELDITDEDRDAFRACIPLAKWQKAHDDDWRKRRAA
jgi:hypothetical protein